MSDKHETLAAIIAEMRQIADNMEASAKRFDEEHKQDDRCRKHPHCLRHDDLMRAARDERNLADRIEAAAERERDAYNAIISGCEATAGELAKERDRAVQYANAAPHPGSASWKEMQAQARKVATLCDSLVEILDRTNREKARDYDAALNGGILEIHDIVNTALNQTKGE